MADAPVRLRAFLQAFGGDWAAAAAQLDATPASDPPVLLLSDALAAAIRSIGVTWHQESVDVSGFRDEQSVFVPGLR